MGYKVSAIVPVYNVEKYFERFLRSAFAQTLSDVEYIFVDDCSPDSSMALLEQVLKEYPERIPDVKILHNEINRGLTYSRNAGLAVASGEYIYQCDSDDWMHSEMFEKMLAEAEKENADIVVCDAEFHYRDSVETYQSSNWTSDHIASMKSYIESEWTVVWNMLIRRSVYETHNILSPVGLTQCEDFHLTTRLCWFAGKIVNLHEPLYCYNRANIVSMTNDWSPKRTESEMMVYEDIVVFFKEEQVYPFLETSINWRILRAKLPMLFDEKGQELYVHTHPECHSCILSCPYYFTGAKIIAWTLTHKLGLLSKAILKLWKLKNGK